MKYTLTIDQRAIVEGGFDLDLVEAAMIHCCRFFSGSTKCQMKAEGAKRYYWFSHKNICDQLPMLKLKPDSVYRRMKALCEKGFFEAHPDNKKANASWYGFGEVADALEMSIGAKSVPSDESPKGIGKISDGPSDESPMYNTIILEEHNKNKGNAGSDEPSIPPPATDGKKPKVTKGEYPVDFEAFWQDSEKPAASKKKAFEQWNRVPEIDRGTARQKLADYKRYQPEARFRQDPERYLKNRTYENDFEAGLRQLQASPSNGIQPMISTFKSATPD